MEHTSNIIMKIKELKNMTRTKLWESISEGLLRKNIQNI